MASGVISTRPQAENAPGTGRYEDFIQNRLEHTRRQVRLVDVATSLMLLATASLLFFLIVALLDQWVFSHGLSFLARLGLLSLWIAGAGILVWRFLVPPLANRINPVFAAQTIEQGRPSLKNSLINFLLLRSHPQDVAPVVYRAMEHRAAADLLKVPADHAMDRGRVVQLACVLAGVVAIFALYLALSPKNPFVSAARVLWPWSSMPAPTRVHIEEVTPGDKGVFNDDHEPIVATVTGLRDGEEVALLVSTADGQMVDERMPMTRVDDANHYRCELPPGRDGFQQDTSYHITAGDATTQQYILEFHVAPTIIVDRIDYHFPSYTELNDRTIKGQGDIKALEGTQVTVYATANMAIKTARIDLNCAGLQTLPMMVAGTKAVGQFKLALSADNPGKPQYDQYSVLFTNADGHEVRRPVRYHIDVDPDMPPEIKIIEPPQGELKLPVDGKLRIHVRASDDYALRWVALHAQREGRAGQEAEDLDLGVLLPRPKPAKAWSKPYEEDFIFQPAEHKLKVGDRVRYWATADDNKEPRANHSDTTQIEKAEPPRIIQIVANGQSGQQNPGDQPPPDGSRQPGENKSGQVGQGTKSENGQGDSKADESSKGEKPSGDNSQDGTDGGKNKDRQDPNNGSKDKGQPNNDGGQGKTQSASDPNPQNSGDRNSSEAVDQPKKTDPLDPDTQKIDVIKESLKDKQEQEKQQQNNPQQQGGDSKPDKGQQGDKPQDKQQAGNQSGDSGPEGGNQQSPGNSGDKKDQGGKSGNQQPQGDNKPGGQDSSKSNSGQGNPQNPGGQGSKDHSPQKGNSGNPSDSGSQSPGNKDSGKPSSDNQTSQPNNGSQNKPSNSPAGSKESQKAGGQPKPDSQNPSGEKGQENQSAGGSPKSEQQKPSGEKGENGSPGGGNPPKAEKKQPGQGSGDEKSPAQGGSKTEEKKPAGGGDSSSQNLPSGKKPGEKPKDEVGKSDGGSQGTKPKQEEKPGGGEQSGGNEQPKPGEGEKEGSSGGKKPGSKSSENKGGTADGQPGQKDPGRTGDPLDSRGAPDSDVDRQRSEQKTGEAHEGVNPDKSQSPGNSPHDSKSEGETRGDRKGGGGPGGGQPDKKTGKGSPGSHSAAESGGAASNERGGDATGNKAGEAVRSTDRTDSPSKEQGKGGGEKTEPADQQAAEKTQNSQKNSSQNSPESQEKSGGQAGAKSSQPGGKQASGPPAGGSPSTASNNSTVATPPAQSGADPANSEFAKKQVDLALEHLKDQKDKGNSELLRRLGWTKEEAEKFLQNMQKLKESAQQPGAEGEAGKKAYNEFLKDLDLHPGGTQIRGGQTKTDNLQGVRDSGQMEPPSEWADQYHAYSQATGQK